MGSSGKMKVGLSVDRGKQISQSRNPEATEPNIEAYIIPSLEQKVEQDPLKVPSSDHQLCYTISDFINSHASLKR